MRKKVLVALGLLASAKVLNVCVPVSFKMAVDSLNSTVGGTEPILNFATPQDTVTAYVFALLLGCEYF